MKLESAVSLSGVVQVDGRQGLLQELCKVLCKEVGRDGRVDEMRKQLENFSDLVSRCIGIQTVVNALDDLRENHLWLDLCN